MVGLGISFVACLIGLVEDGSSRHYGKIFKALFKFYFAKLILIFTYIIMTMVMFTIRNPF
jgi:hypothetical protein